MIFIERFWGLEFYCVLNLSKEMHEQIKERIGFCQGNIGIRICLYSNGRYFHTRNQFAPYFRDSLSMLIIEEFWNFWISKFISLAPILKLRFLGLVFQKFAVYNFRPKCSKLIVSKMFLFTWVNILNQLNMFITKNLILITFH